MSLADTYAVLAASFGPGPWSDGGFKAALILDSNGKREQIDAIKQIFTGKMGGDAAGLAALIGDLKGIHEAPIKYKHHDGHVTVSAGELIKAEGQTFKAANGRRGVGEERDLPGARGSGGEVVKGHGERARLGL